MGDAMTGRKGEKAREMEAESETDKAGREEERGNRKSEGKENAVDSGGKVRKGKK